MQHDELPGRGRYSHLEIDTHLDGGSGTRNSYGFFVSGTLSVATGVAGTVVGETATIKNVRLRTIGDSPVGADLIIDVNKNGTTMFTTQGNRPTIPDGDPSATSAAPDVAGLVEGDYVTIDIDQIGSSTAGSDLAVTLVCA